MIEISISRELAAAHPGFMAGCAERGHAIEVFDSDARSPISRDRSRTTWPGHAVGVDGRSTPGSQDRTAGGPGARRVSAGLRRPDEAGAKSNDERRPHMA